MKISSSSSYVILKVHGDYNELSHALGDDRDCDTWFDSGEIRVVGYIISHASDSSGMHGCGSVREFIKHVESAEAAIQELFPGKQTSIVHFERYG